MEAHIIEVYINDEWVNITSRAPQDMCQFVLPPVLSGTWTFDLTEEGVALFARWLKEDEDDLSF